MKKILFAAVSLDVGGTEAALVTLLNYNYIFIYLFILIICNHI